MNEKIVYERLIVILVFMLLIVSSGSLFSAQTAGDLQITQVGKLPATDYSDIIVRGDYAYCLDSLIGIDIIDTRDPSNPQKVGNYENYGSPGCMYIQNNYIYLADYISGLQVLDISNPTSPVLKGCCAIPGEDVDYVTSVYVEGDYAYITVADTGLTIFDISSPSSPQWVGTFLNKNPCTGWDCSDYYITHLSVVIGDYAYVVDSTMLTKIVDISNPSSPVQVGTFDKVYIIYEIAVKDNYLYCTDGRGGMVILDLSDPLSPQETGRYAIELYDAYDVFISGNYAYIVFGGGRLHVVDISTPSNPVFVGKYDECCGYFQHIFVKENYAYALNDYKEKIVIFNVSDPSNPLPVGHYDRMHYPHNAYISGQYAYIADWFGGLWIVDISDPSKPEVVSNYDLPAHERDVFVRGNYAYIYGATYLHAPGDGLFILDISDPYAPREVGYCTTPGSGLGLTVDGDYAYIADGEDNSLAIIDISDPSSPVNVGNYYSGVNRILAKDVYVKDGYAYLAYEGFGLYVLDVSDPTAPVLAGKFELPGEKIVDVFVSGDYAYATVRHKGLIVLDISTPTAPELAGRCNISHDWEAEVYVSGNYAYLATSSDGLMVIDITDPTSPTLVKQKEYSYQSWGNDVFVKDDYIYLIDNYGLFIFKQQFAASNAQLTVKSSPDAGVPIGVSPVDINEEGDGNTLFTRTYKKGTQVTLTAPAYHNGNMFLKWMMDSSEVTNLTTQFTIDGDTEVTAVYEGIPVLTLDREIINFGADASGRVTPPQLLRIQNTGGGTLSWLIDADVDWLKFSPGSGSGDTLISVSIDPTGLSSGAYTGTLTVTDARFLGISAKVTVNLTFYEVSGAPIGEFATPIDGAVVSGSIPVTGWVVDDLGVERVKIYRLENDSLIFIGDAVFVEGARPDVRDKYPTFPMNYQAGWGYMMLSNSLPNNGNGTYQIRVDAVDIEGNITTLGVKTIHCDNANAVKPFGTIETPGQGGIVTGTRFRNWGWVLTPPPNKIPEDGSTIDVYIDGKFVGHPVYNLYREDVARLFPGYLNSHGAFGYFDIDSTQYESGVHTLQWVVTDNAGNREGIGSRYFLINLE